jgi:hypothetical protein
MKGNNMKSNNLKKRLQKSRPMDVISLRMPKDVVDDLKRIAPLLGFSGYQPLIRAYIGQGLRVDLERLEGGPNIAKFVESLKRRGVTEDIISEAIAEFGGKRWDDIDEDISVEGLIAGQPSGSFKTESIPNMHLMHVLHERPHLLDKAFNG